MKKIVVIESGWVLVGDYEGKRDKTLLTDASVIRLWGTSKGLGEIAINGPTKDTVLDKLGVTEITNKHILFIVECNQQKW